MSNHDRDERWEEIREIWLTPENQWLYAIVGFLAGIVTFPFIYAHSDFLSNLAPEILGILFTVLVIERLNEQREKRLLKAQLIREMGTSDNGIALRAVRELAAYGWLFDGSLKLARLQEANLEKAKLSKASMTQAILFHANLSYARLEFSELYQANLELANLESARMWATNLERASLELANLRDAHLWRANLQRASLSCADLNNANLIDTNLKKANLQYANLQGTILEKAQFDEETILPDQTQWTSMVDMGRFTNPNHTQFWRSDNPQSPAFENNTPD